MLLWAKQPSPSHPPPPLKKDDYFVRKFMVCRFIDRLNLGYGQCSLFLPDCFSVREAVEKKTGVNLILSLRPSQVLCYICLQQKFEKISFTSVTVSLRN